MVWLWVRFLDCLNFFHLSYGDTETIFFQVFVYSHAACEVERSRAEIDSTLNATCAIHVYSPKMMTNEQRVEIADALPQRLEMWQKGRSITSQKMEGLVTVWGPSRPGTTPTTTMRTMNLTLMKSINALDNQTSFSCEVTSRGYEWVGGRTRVCSSQQLMVVNAEKWRKDVIIGE